jgi:hypothetical protein
MIDYSLKHANLNHAAFNNDIDAVSYFLKQRVLKRDLQNGFLNACSKNHIAVVKKLLQYNKKHNLLKEQSLTDSLYSSATKGHLELFKHLYSLNYIKRNNEYLFEQAALHNKKELCTFILKKIDFIKNERIIIQSAREGNLSLLKFLCGNKKVIKLNNTLELCAIESFINGRTNTLKYIIQYEKNKDLGLNIFQQNTVLQKVSIDNFNTYLFLLKKHINIIDVNNIIAKFFLYIDSKGHITTTQAYQSDIEEIFNKFLTVILKKNIKAKISLKKIKEINPQIQQHSCYQKLHKKLITNKIKDF